MALLFMDGFEGRDSLVKYGYISTGTYAFGAGTSYNSAWTTGRFDATALMLRSYLGNTPTIKKFFTPSNSVTLGIAIYNSNVATSGNILIFSGDTGATNHIYKTSRDWGYSDIERRHSYRAEHKQCRLTKYMGLSRSTSKCTRYHRKCNSALQRRPADGVYG